jgi:hypothetical protein
LVSRVIPGAYKASFLLQFLSHRDISAVPTGVEVRYGDLALETGLDEAVTGMDAIIHCASNSREDHFQTDIDGTRALVRADPMAGALFEAFRSGINQIPTSRWRHHPGNVCGTDSSFGATPRCWRLSSARK